VTWLAEAAEWLAGGQPHPPCAAGHTHHATVSLTVSGSHAVPDWPVLPPVWFRLDVFAADAYEGVDGYCPADSEVSRGLLAHGVWEGFESALALAILDADKNRDSVVLDFGANVGWYSMLAASRGFDVLAVEADLTIAAVCEHNLARWADDGLHVCRGWIGSDTHPLTPGPRVRLAKVDLEGAEAEAVRVLEPLLATGLVDYLLVEVTPVFGDGAYEAVNLLERHGYQGFVIPDKGADPCVFAADPLAATLAQPLGVMDFGQANVLWCRM